MSNPRKPALNRFIKELAKMKLSAQGMMASGGMVDDRIPPAMQRLRDAIVDAEIDILAMTD